MADTFKYAAMAEETPNAAQEFLKEQLSKNRYTKEQAERLDASGGATVGAGGEGMIGTGPQYDAQNPTKGFGSSQVTGGGTERYQDYNNTNKGQTAFTDNWVDGAKYQQLRGTGSLNNEAFNQQFAAAKGGAETGTVADDGGGWKLVKQDPGEKTNERKLEYKDLAAQWQAAGYDVRVQDHNPDFEGGTGEIAVRVAGPKAQKEEPNKPIEYSDEIKQAVSRVRSYENDVLSGKTSQDIYGNNNNEENDNKYVFDMNKGIDGIGTEGDIIDSDTAAKSTENFLQSKKSDIMKKYQFKAS